MLCFSTMHAMMFLSSRHYMYVCMSNIITKLKTCVFIFQIDTADLNYSTGNPTVDFVVLSHDNKRRFYG